MGRIIVILFLSVFHFCSSFLVDTNNGGATVNGINDNRYDVLLKLFMDERNARVKLEHFVYQQQQQIQNQQTTISNFTSRVEKVENMTQTPTLDSCSEKYLDLFVKYTALQSQQNQLQMDNLELKNKTSTLENEILNLKQTKAIDQLQAITNLQQVTTSLGQEVNDLKAKDQARGQDLIGLYNTVTTNADNITRVYKDYDSFKTVVVRNFSQIEMTMINLQAIVMSNLTLLEDGVGKQIGALVHNFSLSQKQVGFTAIGTTSGSKRVGTILKFPKTISSYGLSRLSSFLSSGQFIVETDGLYLVMVSITVQSDGDNSGFYIYRNNNIVSGQFYGGRSTTSGYNVDVSGSGSIIIQLVTGDTIYVRMNANCFVYEYLSSLTVLKIR